MTTTIGFLMLAVIVVLLLTNKSSIIPVFGIIPIIAALILGFGLKASNAMVVLLFSWGRVL